MQDSTASQDTALPNFTIHDADNCLAFIKQAAEKRQFTLDLSAMDEIDTVGIQLLIALNKKAIRHQQKLILQKPSRSVMDLITLYNLSDQFVII